MSKQAKRPASEPTIEQLKKELERERARQRRRRSLARTAVLLAVLAAVVALAVYLFPVLSVRSDAMAPALESGDIALAFRSDACGKGGIAVFEDDGKVLIRRVIAQGGDVVDMDEDGTISVNGERLNESYLPERAVGTCDIVLPYSVPDGTYFVLGDHRQEAIDSRCSEMGCIREAAILGRVWLRIWPLQRIAPVIR